MKKQKNRWTIKSALCALALPLAAGQVSTAFAAPDAASAAPAPQSHTDFSGVWESAKLELVVLPEVAGQMTPDAAQRAKIFVERFDAVKDDPARVCLIKGMPWTMLGRARNYPLEVIQYPDRIFMTFELYDQFRNIRVDGPGHPAAPKPDDYAPSPSGWSIARWDGASLVVETTGLPVLNLMGVMQRTEEAKITERWTRKSDPEFGDIIEVEMTVDDPEIFAVPARAHQILKRSKPGVVPGGYNCSLALWDDHIEARKAELGVTE